MKHLTLLLPAALLAATPALAQNELSNFSATGRGGVINSFATDYQVLGINPANLGREAKSRVAFTIGEVGVGVASQTLNNDTFRKLVLHSSDAITAAQRTDLVNTLTGENTLNFNVDVNALALAVSLPKGLGGLAVSYRQRLGGHIALNHNAADILVNGQQAAIVQQYYDAAGNPRSGSTPPLLSAALDGTALQMAWTAEYNIGYGIQVLDRPGVLKLTAGAGYRYIQGLGIADLRISGGSLSAYSSLSPVFNINYGSFTSSPTFNYESGKGLQAVGHGSGFDLGLAAEVGKVVRLGVSVTDLGSMTWTGNVLTASDQNLRFPQYTGLTDYNVVQDIINQFGTSGKTLFTYQTAQDHKADLPAKLRLGGGVHLSDKFEVGLDVTAPLNKVAGNLTSTFVGAGLDFKPVSWVRLSTGVSGGAGYRTSLPLGITFVTHIWEAGFSSRDVTGYFSDTTPYYSAALGFLRFKIGKG
ncbi:MAG: DUF5723 family protein [Janthinobacterium lividum]